MSKRSSFERKVTIAIICIHAAVIFWGKLSYTKQSEPIKTKLVVQTVRLLPQEKKEVINNPVKKPAAAPAVKATPAPTPSPKKKVEESKNTAPKKKESTKKTLSKKEQKYGELIHELEEQLSKIETSPSRHTQSQTLHVPGKITNLQVDCFNPQDAKLIDSNEQNYIEMLSLYLQNALNLPEYGSVKVKIEVDEKGTVSNIKILNAQSTVNQRYLEKILPTLAFPKPYYHLSKTKKHEYVLTFCNELSSNVSR